MRICYPAVVAFILAAAQVRAADPLLSWNDGPSKKAIVEFVTKVTKEGGPDFIPKEERIATFDNDGTLWSEKPLYFQLAFALDRVKVLAEKHPEWREKEPYKAILAGETESLVAAGEKAFVDLVATTHTGMTTEEFEEIVKDWLKAARHPRFKRPYTDLVYQPMADRPSHRRRARVGLRPRFAGRPPRQDARRGAETWLGRGGHEGGLEEGVRVREMIRPQEGSGGIHALGGDTMNDKLVTRRRLLESAAGLGLGLAASPVVRADDPKAPAESFPKDGKEALRRLVAGNKRFVADRPVHPHASREWRMGLTGGQKPFAAVLSCSDSRVPPELVFDQGLGDLFVIRVAGNVFAPDGLGSLQYAWLHLKIPLILVLGHEGCGAVAAALAAKFHQAKEPEAVAALVHRIDPALKGLDPKLTGAAQFSAAVEANVRLSMAQLADNPDAKKALAEKRFELAGAVYQLKTGEVRFLS